MQILVDGRPAAIKKGSSFDLIAENRLFSGSDSYTLAISFPLKDCDTNLEIFGLAMRPEVSLGNIVFDCEIHDRDFVRSGVITVVEISDSEVKCQFLEGRSVQNFSVDFDDTFINELDLGLYPAVDKSDLTPEQAWNPAYTGWQCVALPWVSDESGNPQNFASCNSVSGRFLWSDTSQPLSWQPYLLHICRKICGAMGYSCDLSPWEEHPGLSKLIICNTLPGAWDIDGFAKALPHWSLTEFFDKLEIFLRGEFDIDHREKHVRFRFSREISESVAPVRIDTVLDSFSESVDREGKGCDYIETRAYRYKNPDSQAWKYHSCEWFVRSLDPDAVVRYDTLMVLIEDNRKYLSEIHTGNRRDPQSRLSKVLYAADVDTYFILRNVERTSVGTDAVGIPVFRYKRLIQPINDLGPLRPDTMPADSDSFEDLEFVPVSLDYTESQYGEAMFLSPGSFQNTDPANSYLSVSVDDITKESEFHRTYLQQMIEAGEKTGTSEFYSEIFVGYYAGSSRSMQPHPSISKIEIAVTDTSAGWYATGINLRINDGTSPLWSPLYRLDTQRKFSFSFLHDSIPNPRAVYFIGGRKYLCEKITATFTEDGMSQLLKGEFWPLIDD